MSDVEGDESALIPGTTFGSRTEFKRAVAGILAVTSRSCYFPDNNKEKITARCKIKECSFFVRGRLDSAGCVRLTSANLVHSCPLHSYPIPHSVITQSIARESLQYTEGTRAADVISRARVDHGVAINYKKAYDSVKHEAKKVTRMSEESYGMIQPWLDAMEALNPGSQVAYQDDEHGRVDRVFLALASWSESSKHCLPVISLDACHLRSATSGTMFLASALSPNRDIVILAVGIGKIEDASHWEWFVSNCKAASPLWEEATTVVMSDREKGLSWALESVAPEVPHSYCSFHIKKNVKTQFKTDLGGRIHTLAKCLTENLYVTLIEECKDIDKAATEYLEGISRDNWITCFFTRPRYGQVTTNIAESSNSWLMNEREDTWYGCLTGLVRKVQVRAYEKRNEYQKLSDIYAPWVIARVKKNTDGGRRRLVYPVNDEIVEVFRLSDHTCAVVDISVRCCSCGFWSEHGYPCVHGCAALLSLQKDPMDYISHRYSLERLKSVYEPYAIVVDERTLKNDQAKPPIINLKRGRPRKIRIRNRSEFINGDSPVHCSICRGAGHNARTCERRTKALEDKIKAAKKARLLIGHR